MRSQKFTGYLETRAQVAELADAVRRENGFIVQALLPHTNPAYLVTDYSYLFFSTEHNDDASLAVDTIKGSKLVGG